MLRPLEPAEIATNWQAARAALRRWFILAMLPLLGLLWAAGYVQGLIEGGRDCLSLTRNKESNDVT